MMVIGAKTPAMIKAMTAEVESRNFIVASIRPGVHPYVRKLSGGRVTASAMRSLAYPSIGPELTR